MSIRLLCLTLLTLCSGILLADPGEPNLPAARRSSSNQDRPLAIFFSIPGCQACEQAWKAFQQSPEAASYVSVALMATDFDGQVVLDQWGPAQAPGWTILAPDGTIRDRWTGAWDRSPIGVEKIPAPQPVPQPQPAPAKVNPAPTEATVNSPLTTTAPTTGSTPKVSPGVGYRIQAGYFSSSANAEKCVADLTAKGFHGYTVYAGQSAKGPFYRVLSAIFSGEPEARSESHRLTGSGIQHAVKPAAEFP